jgi:hypothetical protein
MDFKYQAMPKEDYIKAHVGGEGMVVCSRDKYPHLAFKSLHPGITTNVLAHFYFHKTLDVIQQSLPQEFQIKVANKKHSIKFLPWRAVTFSRKDRPQDEPAKSTSAIVMDQPENGYRGISIYSIVPELVNLFLEKKGIFIDKNSTNFLIRKNTIYCVEPNFFTSEALNLIDQIPDPSQKERAFNYWNKWWTTYFHPQADKTCPPRMFPSIKAERITQEGRTLQSRNLILA